jgi:hypothetical protein
VSLRDKFIRNKEAEQHVSTIETILGKKIHRLCLPGVFLMYLGFMFSNLEDNFPLKGLLLALTSGIWLVLGIIILYKLIRFKIQKLYNKK